MDEGGWVLGNGGGAGYEGRGSLGGGVGYAERWGSGIVV